MIPAVDSTFRRDGAYWRVASVESEFSCDLGDQIQITITADMIEPQTFENSED